MNTKTSKLIKAYSIRSKMDYEALKKLWVSIPSDRRNNIRKLITAYVRTYDANSEWTGDRGRGSDVAISQAMGKTRQEV